MELMEALIPLKLRWSTLWSAYLCADQNFLDLAKRSGALHVNIGIESLDQETLVGMNKRANKVSMYKEMLANLRKRGISYSLNFVFGWETESAEAFGSTLAFLREERVPVAYFNILGPYKGTPLYDRMKAGGRIIDIDRIGRWPGIKCHVTPAYCSAREMEEHIKKIHRDFYSVSSMIRRLPLPVTRAHIASWVMNLSERKVSRLRDSTESFDDY